MERSTKIILGLFTIATMVACDKTGTSAHKFMKGGRWRVTELTIGAAPVDKRPKWDIDFCDKQTSCSGTWEHAGGTTHPFHWQFLNVGGSFAFAPGDITSETTTMAYAQCFNFSGEYKVISSTRNTCRFESSETYGYPGKVVVILLEREH